MKPAVCFLWFLCVLFLTGSQQAHAANSFSKSFHQATPVKTVFSFANTLTTKFASSESGHTTDDDDSIFAAEDDDDEQDFIGKQSPVVKPNTVVVTISALPPPVRLSIRIYTANDYSSLLRSCRYLAHRALLI